MSRNHRLLSVVLSMFGQWRRWRKGISTARMGSKLQCSKLQTRLLSRSLATQSLWQAFWNEFMRRPDAKAAYQAERRLQAQSNALLHMLFCMSLFHTPRTWSVVFELQHTTAGEKAPLVGRAKTRGGLRPAGVSNVRADTYQERAEHRRLLADGLEDCIGFNFFAHGPR